MRFKNLVSLVIILGLILSTVACGGDGPDSKEALTVYVLSFDIATQEAIAAFKEKYKDISIEQKQFSDISEYKNSVVSDVLAGKGPDVIIDPFRQFTVKLLVNKGYTDLNELVLGDKELKITDYNENVLNLGIVGGKRYFMPLGYSVSALAATKKSLQTGGSGVIKNLTDIDKLAGEAKKFSEANNNDKYLFDNQYTFTRFIGTSGRSFIDYENKKASMDESDFIKALTTYKQIYSSVLPQTKVKDDQSSLDNLDSGLCVTATIDDSMKPEKVPEKTQAGDKIELFSLPVYDKADVIAKPEITVGINPVCKNKEAAFNLIKLMLSEELQSKNTFMAAPVNLKAFDKRMEAAQGNSGYMKYIKDTNKEISSLSLYDTDIEKIFEDNIKYFLNGGSSAEETAKSINDDVNKYLREVAYSKTFSQDEKKKISVYVEYPNLTISQVITKFNNTYKNLEMVKSMVFSEEELATQLMAGEGPDVMVISSKDMPSMSMLMNNGVFAELDTMISNENNFSISDYNKHILNCGVQNGKRYLIPIEYGIPVLITTKTILEKNGITIDSSNLNLNGLAEIVKKFREKNQGIGKYFFNIINDEFFGTMIENSGISFIDYNNKSSRFNSTEFINLLEIYKEFYMSACPTSLLEKYGSSESRLFQNDICVVYNSRPAGTHTCTAFGVFELWSSEVTVKHLMNENIEVFALPDYYGKGEINGKPGLMIGMNSNSEKKNEAFSFIKYLLSKDIQSTHTNMIPVSGASYQKYVELFSKTKPRPWLVDTSSNEFTAGPLSQEIADSFTSLVNKVNSGKLTDRSITDIIYAELPDFVSGKNTAETTAKTIHQKVSLMLNE